MDLGTLHLLVNLHHLHDGSVDLHNIIQRNLRAQEVPHSQGKEGAPITSLPMSPATVRGLKRWIAAKKTENQDSKKSNKSQTRQSIAKSTLPVMVEPKQASSPLPSPLDRQSHCSSAWTELRNKNQSSNLTENSSAPLHLYSNSSCCSRNEPVISDKQRKQIVSKAHLHGVHVYDSSHRMLRQNEEPKDCECETENDIDPDMEAQWNKSLESKTRGKNVNNGNQSKHFSEKYELISKHSGQKERYAQDKLGQNFDVQAWSLHSKDASISNNEKHTSREQLHSNVNIIHDKTQVNTGNTSHFDLNTFSETKYASETRHTKNSPSNSKEECGGYRKSESSEYHPNLAKKPRMNDVECSGSKTEVPFHGNLPQQNTFLGCGISDNNETKHYSLTKDAEIYTHGSGVHISMNERELPKEESPALVTTKACRWKLPTWFIKRRKNKESVGHGINSPDPFTCLESQQCLSEERERSVDTCEMESIIKVLMKAQECFNETPYCDNKEELREKQLLFLQNSQNCLSENSGHNDKDRPNTNRQLVQILCTFVEAKVMEMVKFAKRIPGFSCLDVQDQARLLKSSKAESFMIGGMPIIDPSRRVFSGSNGQHFKLEEFEKVLPKKFFDGKVQIAKKLEKLQLSERETAILRALVITFPERCPLADKKKVQHIHNILFECFLYELEENYGNIDKRVSSIFDLLNFMIDVAPDTILLHRMFEQYGTYASNQLIAEYIDPC